MLLTRPWPSEAEAPQALPAPDPKARPHEPLAAMVPNGDLAPSYLLQLQLMKDGQVPRGCLSSVPLPGRSAARSIPQSSRQDDLSGNRKQEADSRRPLRKKELSHYLTTVPVLGLELYSSEQPTLRCSPLHSLLWRAGVPLTL